VWLVKPDQTVTLKNVTIGTSEGDQTQIVSGVDPGDAVVMVGVDKLQEGNRVNLQIPGEAPKGGGDGTGGNGGGRKGKKKGTS
jgi:multidrug efflux system membrane fusion protein